MIEVTAQFFVWSRVPGGWATFVTVMVWLAGGGGKTTARYWLFPPLTIVLDAPGASHW